MSGILAINIPCLCFRLFSSVASFVLYIFLYKFARILINERANYLSFGLCLVDNPDTGRYTIVEQLLNIQNRKNYPRLKSEIF